MAIVSDQVIVELQAKVDQYNRNVERAQTRFSRAMNGISRSAKASERIVNTSAKRMGSSLAAAFAAGVVGNIAKQLFDSTVRIDNALKVAGLSGEELERVYKKLYDAAQKNAAPFESLVTLFGRAAQVQDQLGVSTDELVKFAENVGVSLRVSGKSASEASGAILQLSQALGSGVVRAEEYNSINEGAPAILQAVAAGLKEAGGSVSKLKSIMLDGKLTSQAMFRAFEAGSILMESKVKEASLTTEQGMLLITNALTNGVRDWAKGATATKNIGDAFVAMADAINGIDFQAFGETTKEVLGFLGDIVGGVKSAIEFLNKIPQASRELGKKLGTDQFAKHFQIGTGSTTKQIEDRINTAFENVSTQKGNRVINLPAVEVSAVSLADFELPGDDDKDKKKRDAAAKAIEKEAQALRDYIQELQLELSLVNKTNAEKEIANALRRYNVDATSAEGKQIAQLISQIDAETTARENNQKAIEAQHEALNNLFEMGASAIVSIVDGSASAEEAVKRLAIQLALAAAQAALLGSGPLAGLFGGGGLGGLFGGGKGVNYFPPIPGLAVGTNNHQGGLAIVGEKGPELLNLPRGSQVFPTDKSSQMMGNSVIYAPVYNVAQGADPRAIEQLKRAQAEDRQQFKSKVLSAVTDGKRRNQLKAF